MIRIGTRTSKLAMIQTELVKQKIQEHFPKEKIEIVPIITKGDVILHQPLASFGGKGVFTQEIEQQLLDNCRTQRQRCADAACRRSVYRGGACAGRLPRCAGDTDRDFR